MKIQKVDPVIVMKSPHSNKRNEGANPGFTGASRLEQQIVQTLYHKNVIKFLEGFKWLKGEIGGILITAVGTGLVAPIFIGFNPFVRPNKKATPEEKEDLNNTKKYTAMRQPVSAALAILFQASVQKWIDYGLDLIFNDPRVSWRTALHRDRSVINTNTLNKRNAETIMEQNGKQKTPIWKYILHPRDTWRQRDAYDQELNKIVDSMVDNQVNKVAEDLAATHKIHIGRRVLDNQTTAKLVNQQIQSYIEDAEKLMKTPKELDFYTARAEILMKNESHLREIFKEIPLEAIDQAPDNSQELSDLYKRTEKIIKELFEKEKNPDVKMLLQEILDRPEDLRANRVKRTLQRIDLIKQMCESRGGYTKARYLDALLDKNNILDRIRVKLEHAKIKNIAKADVKTIKETIEKVISFCSFSSEDGVIASVLRDTDTFSENTETLTRKVYKDIAKGYKKFVENNYTGMNQVTKILIGVFITLPITCTALNWVYPRFMDIFFPKLAGAKKASNAQKEGGNK